MDPGDHLIHSLLAMAVCQIHPGGFLERLMPLPDPASLKSESLESRVLTFAHLIGFLVAAVMQTDFRTPGLFPMYVFHLYCPGILMEATSS